MPDTLGTAGLPPNEDATNWVLRLALRFGVGSGLAYGAWLVGLHLSGQNAFGPKRQLVHFLIPVAVVASQWALRRAWRPAPPGLGRALAVGGLTALVAAAMAAANLYGLGRGVGETGLARSRAELLTVARENRQFLTERLGGPAAYARHLQQVERLTLGDLARDDFSKILLLGLVLAVPAGVFLRE